MSGCQESLTSEDAPIANPIILTVKEKKCSKCLSLKSIEAFGKDRRNRDGHGARCMECGRNYYRMNLEKERLRTQKYRKNNLEKLKAAIEKWRKENPDKMRESMRAWRKANKERVKESHRNWRKKNPTKIKEISHRSSAKRLNTPRGRLNARMTSSIWGSLNGTKKGRRWESLVGYTVEDLKKHLEKQFKEGMSWEKYLNGEIHIDHKIPKSKFNYEKAEDEDFKRCWALKNLQPLWAGDNLKKSDKLKKHFQPKLIF